MTDLSITVNGMKFENPFLLGSGPVRGFAVVHCLGILTSMFSAVAVSRSIVNLVFGARKKLEGLPIGNVDWHRRAVKPA